MRCVNCNSIIPDNAVFCSQCGTRQPQKIESGKVNEFANSGKRIIKSSVYNHPDAIINTVFEKKINELKTNRSKNKNPFAKDGDDSFLFAKDRSFKPVNTPVSPKTDFTSRGNTNPSPYGDKLFDGQNTKSFFRPERTASRETFERVQNTANPAGDITFSRLERDTKNWRDKFAAGRPEIHSTGNFENRGKNPGVLRPFDKNDRFGPPSFGGGGLSKKRKRDKSHPFADGNIFLNSSMDETAFKEPEYKEVASDRYQNINFTMRIILCLIYAVGIAAYFIPWVTINFFGEQPLLSLAKTMKEISDLKDMYGIADDKPLIIMCVWSFVGVTLPIAFLSELIIAARGRSYRNISLITGFVTVLYTGITFVFVSFIIRDVLSSNDISVNAGLFIMMAVGIALTVVNLAFSNLMEKKDPFVGLTNSDFNAFARI